MDPKKSFRQSVFNVCLDHLESEWMTPQEVCECLKECIEFFWCGSNSPTTRDFCIVKLHRSKSEKAQG
jgi:hypothetical protein